MKKSKDGRCIFNEEFHTYHVDGKKYKGVTSFISEYKNKFNAEEVAANYVKKHGGDVAELLAKWKLEGELSCIYGSAVHDVFENYILHKEIITTGKYPKEEIAVKFITDYFLSGRLIPVDAEVVIYSEEMQLASMIDCVAMNQDGLFYIFDWKTNKKIETNGYGKRMFPPFEDYEDCNYSHYSLQVNLYENMYKENKVEGSYIVHLSDTDYNIIKPLKIKI